MVLVRERRPGKRMWGWCHSRRALTKAGTGLVRGGV